MRRDRGQLTVGLAVGFSAVVAIFALLLQASLIFREKMKFQQTADLAALVAADVQKLHLNEIQKYNDQIDKVWEPVQAFLLNPELWACIPTGVMPLLQVREKASRSIGNPTSIDDDRPNPIDECDVLCGKYDADQRNIAIDRFTAFRAERASRIQYLLNHAGVMAQGKTNDTFLNPHNLPVSLALWVKTRFGDGTTTQQLRQAYDRGELRDRLQIDESRESSALFEATTEVRSFTYPTFHYQTLRTGGPFPVENCSIRSTGGGAKPVPIKVVRRGSYEPVFVASATYNPSPNEELNKSMDYQKLFLRDPSNTKNNEPLRDLTGQKVRVVRNRGQMMVVSLAKPFGGSLPTGGTLANTDRGNPGAPYGGDRLVGIADKPAYGGYDLGLGGEIPMEDVQGHPQSPQRYLAEDFLH